MAGRMTIRVAQASPIPCRQRYSAATSTKEGAEASTRPPLWKQNHISTSSMKPSPQTPGFSGLEPPGLGVGSHGPAARIPLTAAAVTTFGCDVRLTPLLSLVCDSTHMGTGACNQAASRSWQAHGVRDRVSNNDGGKEVLCCQIHHDSNAIWRLALCSPSY
jgi:hypothetical protein